MKQLLILCAAICAVAGSAACQTVDPASYDPWYGVTGTVLARVDFVQTNGRNPPYAGDIVVRMTKLDACGRPLDLQMVTNLEGQPPEMLSPMLSMFVTAQAVGAPVSIGPENPPVVVLPPPPGEKVSVITIGQVASASIMTCPVPRP